MRNEWGPPSSNVAIAENEFSFVFIDMREPFEGQYKKESKFAIHAILHEYRKNIKNINKDEKKLEQLTK